MQYFYQKTELLFAHKSIPALCDCSSARWKELVFRVAALPEVHEDSLAFSLMMIRLCGCLKCNPGSYKASLGCPRCAQRVIRMTKGSDSVLLQRFRKARRDVLRYLEAMGGDRATAEAPEG